MKVATALHASGGGAVLERPPAFDQSQLDTLPVTHEGGDPGRAKDGIGGAPGAATAARFCSWMTCATPRMSVAIVTTVLSSRISNQASSRLPFLVPQYHPVK